MPYESEVRSSKENASQVEWHNTVDVKSPVVENFSLSKTSFTLIFGRICTIPLLRLHSSQHVLFPTSFLSNNISFLLPLPSLSRSHPVLYFPHPYTGHALPHTPIFPIFVKNFLSFKLPFQDLHFKHFPSSKLLHFLQVPLPSASHAKHNPCWV